MTKASEKRVVEFVTTTPSGIEVLFQAEPKRLYRVRGPYTTYDGEGHREDWTAKDADWREVPSVTTVLEVLDKPGLTWWGMRVGIEGVVKLVNLGLLKVAEDWWAGQQVLVVPTTDGGRVAAGLPNIEPLLKELELRVDKVRDTAGDRGNSVHKALEHFAQTGDLPDSTMYPPEEQGYVYGLRCFLADVQPVHEASEVVVGSVKHGFAGRYDWRFRTEEDRAVVFHRTPVKGPQYAILKAGRYLLDLKTSKDVYVTHAKQLEGYELGSVECGYPATDARGILNVHDDGTYKFVRSWATADDFLTTLAEWRSQEAMKERRKG